MASFKDHLVKAAWTGAEVIAVTGGAVAAQHFLSRDKFFEKQMQAADWDPEKNHMYKFFGAIKLGGACLAANYIDNPWLKLAILGVGMQGGLELANTMMKKDIKIGDNKDLNAKLKQLAEEYRNKVSGMTVNKPEYFSGVSGKEYYSGVSGWGNSGWNAAA